MDGAVSVGRIDRLGFWLHCGAVCVDRPSRFAPLDIQRVAARSRGGWHGNDYLQSHDRDLLIAFIVADATPIVMMSESIA